MHLNIFTDHGDFIEGCHADRGAGNTPSSNWQRIIFSVCMVVVLFIMFIFL